MERGKLSPKAGSKKIRKLYHLEPQDVAFIREYAQKRKISESEVIRLSVRKLQEEVKADPFKELLGSVRAGNGQAVRHDEAIYE